MPNTPLASIAPLPHRRRCALGELTVLRVGLSFLSLLGPFCVTDLPPLTDYPNHLARYWLIGGGVQDSAMSAFFRIDWTNAVTNVGVDRVVALLSPPLSGLVVGHAATVVAAVLPPLGALALCYAVNRRVTALQALIPLAAWSTTFLMGFVNFQIGLGLALLFASIDPLVQPRLWRGAVAMRPLLGLILGVDHMFALLFYAVLLAGLAMGPAPLTKGRWSEHRARVGRAALAAAWCLIPLAIVAFPGNVMPGAQPVIGDLTHSKIPQALPGKLATLFTPLASYNVVQEVGLAAILIALFARLNQRRVLNTHTGLMVAVVGLFALAVLTPGSSPEAAWLDRRFPIMALLSGLAAVQLRADVGARFERRLGAACLGLVCLQSAWVGWNWRAARQDQREVRLVLANVPAGAAILPVQHVPTLSRKWFGPAGRYLLGGAEPTFRHLAAISVPMRRAFVPMLFSAKGLQPLRVRGIWDSVVEHNGGELASVNALIRPRKAGEAVYLDGWRDRFDYVLVLNADMPDGAGPFRPPPELTLVSTTSFAQLWRVIRLGARR